MLELIGSSTNHDSHSFGISLLSDLADKRNYVVSSGWGESAIITDEATLVFSTETYNLNTFEIRDKNYELLMGDRYSEFFDGKDVNEVILNMGKFLK